MNFLKNEVIWKKVKRIITPLNLVVFIILVFVFLVRVYRLDQILGFYFDQGRDALIIWDLWHKGKFFLIGPVTGLAGIFLGPLYYYLIAPFYLLGGGDPVYPAVFLGLLTTIASFLLYKLGKKIHSKEAGIIALVVSGFSYSLVLSSRWLSNPTPILLSSVILFWSLWEIVNRKNQLWWVVASLIIGVSLQFESASGIFYLPLLAIFTLWQALSVEKGKRNLPGVKIILLSGFVFFLTLVPQLYFNFRHENILLKGVTQTFFKGKSFSANFLQVLPVRAKYFWDVASSKILPERGVLNAIFFVSSLVGLFLLRKKLSKFLILSLIFLGTPIVGMTLFQGNFGNIYDYYLTGYYLPFILVFSVGLAELFKRNWGKVVILTFLVLFLYRNLPLIRNYIISGVDGPNTVAFGNEKQALDWIYQDMGTCQKYNTDVYVPPVIPHAYNYLFTWYGGKVHNCKPEEKLVNLLYTIYEVDPPHPERLEAWLKRQATIGKVIKEEKFGGIVVQRRERISNGR